MPVASYKSIFLHFQRDLILSPAPICWRFHKAYLPWPELVSWQGNCLLRNVCLFRNLKERVLLAPESCGPAPITPPRGGMLSDVCGWRIPGHQCAELWVTGSLAAVHPTQNSKMCCLIVTNLFVADWHPPSPTCNTLENVVTCSSQGSVLRRTFPEVGKWPAPPSRDLDAQLLSRHPLPLCSPHLSRIPQG